MEPEDSRTLIRRPEKTRSDYFAVDNKDGDFWELCIDESAGCGERHYHDYGHDFPMTRAELVQLREQIDAALDEDPEKRIARAALMLAIRDQIEKEEEEHSGQSLQRRSAQ